MREFDTTLGGEDVSLAANFKASEEIARKVGDPLLIAREAHLEALLTRPGMPPYDPKWKFTVSNVPVIWHIGMKAAGDKRTLEDVQNLVFDEGFIAARDKVTEYLALIIGPRSEEITDTKGTSEPGE